METPAITSREVVENLEADVKLFNNELIIIEKVHMRTWNEVLHQYLSKLY